LYNILDKPISLIRVWDCCEGTQTVTDVDAAVCSDWRWFLVHDNEYILYVVSKFILDMPKLNIPLRLNLIIS